MTRSHGTDLITALLTTSLVLGTASCATTPPRKVAAASITAIADDLLAAAERNATLGKMRVYVVEVMNTIAHEEQEKTAGGEHGHPVDPISIELEHQFVVALSQKLSVIDDEVAEDASLRPSAAVPSRENSPRERHPDATHLVVGDYTLRGDNMVNVTLRLVDVSSYLIVAAARGVVTQEELGLDLRRHDARATRK